MLSKENVTVSKIWAPKLKDVQREVDILEENVDVIAIHSMTNDLGDCSVDEIVNLVIDVAEKCCLKAKKVVISSIVNRDDNILMDTKAEAVNANIKLKFVNNPNISLCGNENLKDKKFRSDLIHLTDRGVSRLANNLKYKIAGALGIPVKKKSVDNRPSYENTRRFNYY